VFRCQEYYQVLVCLRERFLTHVECISLISACVFDGECNILGFPHVKKLYGDTKHMRCGLYFFPVILDRRIYHIESCGDPA
jgi:hypothetical protein